MDSPMSELGVTPKPSGIRGKLSTIHVVAYIGSAILSRQYSGWQVALGPGFGSFIIAQVLTTMGCICHYLCLMEIWSAVPFSGGNYALSRATLGFYLGFLDGVMEALVYISHTSLSALSSGMRFCIIFDMKPDHATMFALLFYIGAVCIAVQTNLIILRRSFMVFGAIALLILLIYCFWSLKWSNFMENASLHRAEPANNVDNWFQNGWVGFVTVLPYTLQPYAGIRSFTLLTGMTENPKTTLPRATLTSFTIIIALNILVIFVFASQPGRIEHTAQLLIPPMKTGWSLIFNQSAELTSKITSILTLPASFARVFSYLIPSGVLLHSLGNSNLMPSVLMVNHNKDHTTGVVVAAIFGMGFCVILHYYPVIELFNLAVMGTMITDYTFLYGYILLKTTYSTVPREFVSPFGITGAIFSIVMYVLIFISSAFYQKDYFGLKFFACLIVILTVYYFAFASRTQTLCEEEDQVFMKLHVRNYNMAKKQKLQRKQSYATGWKGMVLSVNSLICATGGRHSARVAVEEHYLDGEVKIDEEVDEQVHAELAPTSPLNRIIADAAAVAATGGSSNKSAIAAAADGVVTSTSLTTSGRNTESSNKLQLTLACGTVIGESGLVEGQPTVRVELGATSGSDKNGRNQPSLIAESVSQHSGVVL